MRADSIGPFGNPLVKLAHVGQHTLTVAVVAEQLFVLAGREATEWLFHDVAPRAEGVVVHHEVPRLVASQAGAADDS
jgi:hypothetical protein